MVHGGLKKGGSVNIMTQGIIKDKNCIPFNNSINIKGLFNDDENFQKQKYYLNSMVTFSAKSPLIRNWLQLYDSEP